MHGHASRRIVFDGKDSKVEKGMTNMFLPNVIDAQQPPYLAFPLRLVPGDESFELTWRFSMSSCPSSKHCMEKALR
jgi:hypothetical protein